jgi:hypothetical protein
MKTSDEMLRDFEDYLDRVGLRPKPKPPVVEKPKVVKLATANPDVPLERQRKRIEEQVDQLDADMERKLREWEEEKRRERRTAELQQQIDWHWEMQQRHREAAERYDPIYNPAPCHRD